MPEPGAGRQESDRVIVAAGRPCPHCRRGGLAKCLPMQLMAFASDGARADYMLAKAVCLARIPDNVAMEQAANLADMTTSGAVVRPQNVERHQGNPIRILVKP